MANDYLPFCETDSGTNLLSEAAYLASAGRTSGNQPGTASSQLVNKALRQATAITTGVAQAVSDLTATDLIDDANATRLLQQIKSLLTPLPPVLSRYTSGAGTHNLSYYFFCASASATLGATYTNNGVTFTVGATISGATLLRASGNGAPLAAGTLTKASGSGDATIAFYAVRAPIYLESVVVGGGGGGAAGVNNSTTAVAGGSSGFGSSLISATGGTQGVSQSNGGTGGTGTIGAGASGDTYAGSNGSPAVSSATGTIVSGPDGGTNPLGGAGRGGNQIIGIPSVGKANTGAGGGAGGTASTGASTGGSGAAGGYARGVVTAPTGSYPYLVGAGGAGGVKNNSSGQDGAAGAAGVVTVQEFFQ